MKTILLFLALLSLDVQAAGYRCQLYLAHYVDGGQLREPADGVETVDFVFDFERVPRDQQVYAWTGGEFYAIIQYGYWYERLESCIMNEGGSTKFPPQIMVEPGVPWFGYCGKIMNPKWGESMVCLDCKL